MQHKHQLTRFIQITGAFAFVTIVACGLLSFKKAITASDALSALGITSSQANEKIFNSFTGGYVNTWGLKNLRSIAQGNKAALANELLAYTKTYVQSADFATAYASEKEAHKPELRNAPETPEQFGKMLAEQAKMSFEQAETYYKNATEEEKASFKESLEESKQYYIEMQKPDNDMVKAYKETYGMMVDNFKADSAARLATWHQAYPDNPMLFVKQKLEEFLALTADVDFNAATVERNGKTYFTNQQYERKDYRWKMAFRAGSDVTTTARIFAQQWLKEIK